MLTLTFEPKQQTRQLRASGFTVAQLKAAGFSWQSGAWVAKPQPQAEDIYTQVMRTLEAMSREGERQTSGTIVRQVCVARTDHVCNECGRSIGSGEEAMRLHDQTQGVGGPSYWLCTCCYDYGNIM